MSVSAAAVVGIISLVSAVASSSAKAGAGAKASRQQNELLDRQNTLLEKSAQHGRKMKGRELDRSESASRFNRSLFNKQNAATEADLKENAAKQRGLMKADNISSIGQKLTGTKLGRAQKNLMRIG